MQQLRDFAQANYDLIGLVVIGVGNFALTVGKTLFDLSTPILQDFFA
ncbi:MULTISPECIES: hypothetical protein [Nocardia]|uniref:Uncharacterized protein n=3 Tax=Nocardia TaxID=1817 RepID=A0A4R6P2D7_NOCIG|nr:MULTISPECIES: hypothetical protein [Nocardia]KAF0845164.1 hypothetical protein FNL39_109193 [Nocardia caishijiensis]MCA2211135.1 hypothetical protein [Nocardia rosealba]NKX91174.1 hypothetical protein [Nocardia coubleae]TDP28712.1 hypothetical protein DFR75_11519 [Nocardia ignorata]